MRQRICAAALGLIVLLAASTTALGADPAEFVVRDVLVYIEVGPELTQDLVGALALPPVAGLFVPDEVRTPMSHVAHFLDLPGATVDEAAPHLEKIIVAAGPSGGACLLVFDDPKWPQALLARGKPGNQGLLVTSAGIGGVAEGEILLVSHPSAVWHMPLEHVQRLTREQGFEAARDLAHGAPVWAYVHPRAMNVFLDDLVEFHRMAGRGLRATQVLVETTGLDRAEYGLLALHPATDGGSVEATIGFRDEMVRVLDLLPEAADGGAVPDVGPLTLALHWGDAGTFFGGIRDIILEWDDSVGYGEVRAGIGEIETGLGFGFDELLATLGSGAVAYLPAAGPGALMRKDDWTVAFRLSDTAAFDRILRTALANAIGAALVPVTHEGTELARIGALPVYCRIADNAAVFGGSPGAVKAHLDAAPTFEVGGLLSLKADLGLLLTSYPTIQPGAKLSVRAWREGHEVRLSAAVTDVDMARFGRRALTTYPVVMAAMLMPAMSRARYEARKSSGQANLHNIGLGIRMYQNDYDGEYPPDLEELVRLGYVPSADILLDPADRTPDLTEEMQLEISYVYVGPLPRNVAHNVIMGYSREGIYPGGRNVLFIYSAAEFAAEAALADPAGNVRTSLRVDYDAVVEAFGLDLTPERDAELRLFYEIEE